MFKESFYPSVDEYYATLGFDSGEINASLEEYEKNIEELCEGCKHLFDDAEVVSTEDITINGVKSWIIQYKFDVSKAELAMAFNPKTKEMITIFITFDEKDESDYDYFGDFREMLNSVAYSDEKTSNNDETGKRPENGINKEFKDAMDSYEEFIDEYLAFMEKYEDSNNSASMLADYMKFLNQYTETMEKMEAIDKDGLSTEELNYYNEVMLRISQKILKATSD